MADKEKSLFDLTNEVIASFEATKDERLREIITSVVRHSHDLVRELRLTQEEWAQAISFLTEVGKKCDDVRQEFVLLSDILGVSMLVESINSADSPIGGISELGHPSSTPATESTVLGPFHMTQSPARISGDTISAINDGTPLVVEGHISGRDGAPLADASVDIWQCDSNGFYDVQQPEVQSPGNGRGLFKTDAEGRFDFVTVEPSYYPIPTDGPGGALLRATGRHPFRPAHIHFIVRAPRHQILTTHIFMPESPYLDSDAVFAVKPSLICETELIDDPEEGLRIGVSPPFKRTKVNLVLRGLGEAEE